MQTKEYKNIMQCTDLKVKMNRHRNGQTYERYVGDTTRGRHENVKVLRKEIHMNLNMKMMIHETKKA